MNIQRVICAALVMGATVFTNVDANANQEYPTKPIKIIVGFSAGGGSDLVARILADTLGKKLNQSVIVENKPGAGGVLATKSVAREKPDGYVLIMGSAAAFVINPYLIRDIGYDPINDFTPIGSVARFQYVLMGRDNLPVSTLFQLIDYAKKHPDALNIGSAGIGSNTHLVALSFMAKTGIKLTHVPYKGTAGALNDLQGRNIDLLFDSACAAGRRHAIPCCSNKAIRRAFSASSAAKGSRSIMMGPLLSQQVAQAKSRSITKAEANLKYVVQSFSQGKAWLLLLR